MNNTFVFPRKPLPGEPLKREREEEGVELTDDSVQDTTGDESSRTVAEPPKKKRRVALTRVGDLGS